MIDISKIENVHFIGIGGTGMNGLAQLAILNNFNVSEKLRYPADDNAEYSPKE